MGMEVGVHLQLNRIVMFHKVSSTIHISSVTLYDIPMYTQITCVLERRSHAQLKWQILLLSVQPFSSCLRFLLVLSVNAELLRSGPVFVNEKHSNVTECQHSHSDVPTTATVPVMYETVKLSSHDHLPHSGQRIELQLGKCGIYMDQLIFSN